MRNSAVVWSWGLNALRLGSGLILLPLVLRKLPTPELGMYYVFLAQIALVPLVDFGFGLAISRYVAYAMAGAERLQAQGMGTLGISGKPNLVLLWDLLAATRRLYGYLALILVVLLGTYGTFMVESAIHETSSVVMTRVAWILTVLSASYDLYSGWWGVFLRNLNQVVLSTRLNFLSVVCRLVISATLLLLGAGLVSLPIGTLIGGLVYRTLARKRCLEIVPRPQEGHRVDILNYLKLLWPNSWRTGVQFFSAYLTTNANMAICTHMFRLSGAAEYGLSIQLFDILAGMASVWISVKWPLIGQNLARQEYPKLVRIISPRIALQNVSFLIPALVLAVFGDSFLRLIGTEKHLLTTPWLPLLLLNSFFFIQFTFWTTLILTSNRLPYLWPTVATNVLSLILSLLLVRSFGIGGLVLGPLIAGCLFNYWYWPWYGMRVLHTTVPRFLFGWLRGKRVGA